ncbi:MAG TPA: ABC transporter substrate-binding protein [Dehalococcoidia bacterium]|nr:ABC transporter substrate-binding protein [Dehalococcoidia bacterium]
MGDDRSENYWLRLANRQFSRRRLLGTGIGGAAALGLAACGSSNNNKTSNKPAASSAAGAASPAAGNKAPTQANTGGQVGALTATVVPLAPGANAANVKKGGTFVVLNGGEPRTLDPHFDTFPFCTAIADNVYNAVMKFTPDLTKITTDLAVAMPEQPDDKTYIFKLQQGVKFQDVQPVGPREFTADDVKYSIERQATNDPGKFQHGYYFRDKLDSIQVVDKYTVKFVTKAQYAPFMSYIASPWTVIVPHEAVEKFGDLTANAIGTGPFIFDSWEKNVQTTLHKNPNYFRKDAAGNALPYVDKLTIKYVVDPQAQLNQFVQGNLDAGALQFNYAKQASDSVKGANSQAVPSQFWKEFRTQPWDGQKYMQKAPYTDIRFRQALVQAIDKQEVLDTVYSLNGKGDGILTFGPILPIYKPWALTSELAGFDPKKALDMLKASGVDPNTFSDQIIFANQTSIDQQVGEVILAQLQKNLGLKKVSLMPMQLAEYYNKTYAYDYGMSHHTPLNSPDPDENLSSYFGRTSTFYKWGNTQIWDLIDKQGITVDPQARLPIVQDAQKMIVQDFPMAFLYTANLHLFTQPYVKGWFFPQDLYDGRVETVWIDK